MNVRDEAARIKRVSKKCDGPGPVPWPGPRRRPGILGFRREISDFRSLMRGWSVFRIGNRKARIGNPSSGPRASDRLVARPAGVAAAGAVDEVVVGAEGLH